MASEMGRLRTDNKRLTEALAEKSNEVLRLETQLVPFRTEALRRFPGDEQHALAKLAERLHELEASIERTREYSEVAAQDALGTAYLRVGNYLWTSKTSVTHMLEGTYMTDGRNGSFVRTDRDAELVFRAVIRQNPKFPFAFYFLARCLKQRGAPEWKVAAQEAGRLFENTTQITEHHADHDAVLQKVRLLLAETERS